MYCKESHETQTATIGACSSSLRLRQDLKKIAKKRQ